MNITIVKGPSTVNRIKTDESGARESKDGKPVMEALEFGEDDVLVADGKNAYLVERSKAKAAYLFDEGKKRILLYSNAQLLIEYNYEKDVFSIDSKSPEDLVTILNTDYFLLK